MSTVEDRLKAMGLALPPVAKPVAAYVPAVRAGRFVYTSGQLPTVRGELLSTGRLGESVSLEDGHAAARQCALNALAAIKSVAGDLDQIEQVVRVGAFVASTDDFTQQPQVANGASELLGELFGKAGAHARAAVACNVLPLNAPVEVELIVLMKAGA